MGGACASPWLLLAALGGGALHSGALAARVAGRLDQPQPLVVEVGTIYRARGGSSRPRRSLSAALLLAPFGAPAVDGQACHSDDMFCEAIAGFDSNQDGYIDHGEFLEGARELIFEGRPTAFPQLKYYEEVFRNMDRNRDGRLSRDEVRTLSSMATEALDSAYANMMSTLHGLNFMDLSILQTQAAIDWLEAVGYVIEASVPKQSYIDMARGVVTSYSQFSILDPDLMIEWFEALVESADMNQDGIILPEEAHLIAICSGMWRSSQPWAISKEDSKKNSLVNQIEKAHFIGDPEKDWTWTGHLFTEEEEDWGVDDAAISGTLAELDSNGDGQISVSEYLDAAWDTDDGDAAMQRATRLFVDADLNKDASLDRWELVKLLKAAYGEYHRR